MKLGFGSFMPSVQNQKRFYRSDITWWNQIFFLIELSSVGIHVLYLTIPTLMIPCNVSDKKHTFALCMEREEASDSDWGSKKTFSCCKRYFAGKGGGHFLQLKESPPFIATNNRLGTNSRGLSLSLSHLTHPAQISHNILFFHTLVLAENPKGIYRYMGNKTGKLSSLFCRVSPLLCERSNCPGLMAPVSQAPLLGWDKQWWQQKVERSSFHQANGAAPALVSFTVCHFSSHHQLLGTTYIVNRGTQFIEN